MRSTFVLSLVGLCLSVSAALIGCGDDVTVVGPGKVTKSQLGESCARTDDCDEDLACFNGFCAANQSGDGGAGTVGPGGPVLSAEGESCTRTADCESSLACIQLTCVTGPGGGEGGGGPVANLGERGEACERVADCGPGLTCIKTQFGAGVCDLDDYGLEPTGKTCGGECAAAEDCCELPPNTYASCEDILAIVGTAAACAAPSVDLASPCFYYNTYCECGNIWACTANKCAYTAACTVSGNTDGGCPSASRTGLALNSTCDTVANKCTTPPVCTTSASCLDQFVVGTGDTCSAGECACEAGQCYRRCDEDFDCPSTLGSNGGARYVCGAKNLCEFETGCGTNAQCAVLLNDVRAVCQDEACKLPCAVDHDCSGSGLADLGPFFDRVCGADGFCGQTGCTNDAECSSGNGRHAFCVDATSLAPPTYTNAVSD